MDENVKERGAYDVFVLTAVTFFLAEMGDKTQIIAHVSHRRCEMGHKFVTAQ